MYPDLSYILHHLIGTQPDNAASIVKTFGLLLVIAILTAAWMLNKELIRKEKEGLLKPSKIKITEGKPASAMELIGNAILGLILGLKIVYIFQNFAEFKLDPAGVILSAKGNWLGGIIGALLFAGFKFYEKHSARLPKPVVKHVKIYPHERLGDITILAAISGIVGAKIFAMLEDLDLLFSGDISMGDFINQFFSGSGMAIYGGLIVAFFAVFYYLKKKNITPIHVMDAVAPALIVSYGVGRLGCHLSGDGDWGIVSELANRPAWLAFLPDWLWAFDYPHNVIEEGSLIEDCTWRYCRKLDQTVYPTSVYELVMALGLGGFLWGIRKKVRIAGMLFFIYVFLNGFERFWIEKIRVNERYDVLGIQTTQAEFIAVVLMLIGIVGCLFLWQRHKKAKAG